MIVRTTATTIATTTAEVARVVHLFVRCVNTTNDSAKGSVTSVMRGGYAVLLHGSERGC